MIRSTAQKIADALVRFHNDETGAEGLEKLLIVAAIVLPLLGVLIYFRGQINEWVSGNWTSVKAKADDQNSLAGGGTN